MTLELLRVESFPMPELAGPAKRQHRGHILPWLSWETPLQLGALLAFSMESVSRCLLVRWPSADLLHSPNVQPGPHSEALPNPSLCSPPTDSLSLRSPTSPQPQGTRPFCSLSLERSSLFLTWITAGLPQGSQCREACSTHVVPGGTHPTCPSCSLPASPAQLEGAASALHGLARGRWNQGTVIVGEERRAAAAWAGQAGRPRPRATFPPLRSLGPAGLRPGPSPSMLRSWPLSSGNQGPSAAEHRGSRWPDPAGLWGHGVEQSCPLGRKEQEQRDQPLARALGSLDEGCPRWHGKGERELAEGAGGPWGCGVLRAVHKRSPQVSQQTAELVVLQVTSQNPPPKAEWPARPRL